MSGGTARVPPWAGLWLLVVAVALLARPVLPVDETRYLAVAWEMWQGGDYLVPHLNGAPYSHKPPLLFWLIDLGWAVFGVNEWWPRLISPLFGLGTLMLTARLARRLWPARPEAARWAPLVLMGSTFWALYTTLTMFDMLLAFFALAALSGLIDARRRSMWRGLGVFALAVGLGALAKGPAILLATLPAALLAPLWAVPSDTPLRWGRWYAGVAVAVAAGTAIALAWALPAAEAGGAAYGNAILWGQTAGRVVKSFAHERPWWWFAAVLPAMALPWLAWPPLWRAVANSAFWRDQGVRFCAAWFVPAFIAFSLISGKQPHYLLPVLPALALAAAFALANAAATSGTAGRRLDGAAPGLISAAVGAAIAAMGVIGGMVRLPAWAEAVEPAWGLVPLAAGLVVAAAARGRPATRLAMVAGLSAVLVAAVHMAARPALARYFDPGPLARQLARWERAGIPLAHFGPYHGQYHFAGRLEKPLAVIGVRDPDIETWLADNPGGRIVSYAKTLPGGPAPAAVFPFRGKLAVVWDAAVLKANRHIADR